jgi:hypothetical protein
MSPEQSLSERDRRWLEHIRACAGGSLSAYAQANDLNAQRLYAAKSRLKAKGVLAGEAPKRLVRVQPQRASAPVGERCCRIYLRNGVVLEVALSDGDWATLLSSAAALP